jgi:hypothetical protein
MEEKVITPINKLVNLKKFLPRKTVLLIVTSGTYI